MYLLAIFLVLPTVAGVHHLATRYAFGARARIVLAATGLVALAIPYAFIRYHFPETEPIYLYVGTFVFGVPCFVLLAVIVAEVWRKGKQAPLDRAIAELRHERAACQEKLYALEQRLELANGRRAEIEAAHPEALDEQARLRAQLDAWERGGAVPRIRIIKMGEWQAETRSLDEAGLARREGEVLAELEEARGQEDRERASHLEAQLAVIRLALLTRRLGRPSTERDTLEKQSEALKAEKREIERRLPELKLQMQDLEERRREFLSERIPLE